jgi:hypothetical protein
MSTDQIRRYAGWAALVAGSVEILGLICLLLFFSLELPQGSTSTLRFGYLSDVIPILIAPVNTIVIVMIFLLQRKQAPGFSATAALLGMAGILLTAWTNTMFVSGKITLEQQIQLFYLSLAFLGPWHILVNWLARHGKLLPARLTVFGILVGVGQVILCIGSLLLGEYGDMLVFSPTALMTNIPLLISLVIGIPMALIGYVGAPIWLVGLGKTLLRSDRKIPSLNSPDVTN